MISLWCHKGCWQASYGSEGFVAKPPGPAAQPPIILPAQVAPSCVSCSPLSPGAAPPAPLSKRHRSIFFAPCHRHFLFLATLAFFSPTLSSPSYLTPTRSRLYFSFFFLSHSPNTMIIPSSLYLLLLFLLVFLRCPNCYLRCPSTPRGNKCFPH